MVSTKAELRESLEWAIAELEKLASLDTGLANCPWCGGAEEGHNGACPLGQAKALVNAIYDPKDFERWRNVYEWEIPAEVLLEWLSDLGWSNVENYDAPPLVEFHPISDPEDSYFNVNGSDNDCKTSLQHAIKKAYFAYQDKLKEERRRIYAELKKEFEPS